MYAFIWLHLITPVCFWKLEFPSNRSGSGENAARSLQAFLLQKLLGVFAATSKSSDDSHPRVLSRSVGLWIKEPSVTGADGSRRERLESLFSSRSLVPFRRMQQCDRHAGRAAMRILIRLIHIPWQRFLPCPPHPSIPTCVLYFGIF